MAPKIDLKSYYCCKGFYLVYIQGIVDKKHLFCDFDYRWASNIHNWCLFRSIDIGKKVRKEKLLPYKLIGDVEYHNWRCRCNYGSTFFLREK